MPEKEKKEKKEKKETEKESVKAEVSMKEKKPAEKEAVKETVEKEKKEAGEQIKEEVKEEVKEVKEVKKEVKVEVSPKVSSVLETVKTMSPEEREVFAVSMIKGLNVLELSKWVKSLEEEFGVSAAAPAAVSAASGVSQGEVAPEEKKTSWTVVLVSSGDKKIQVIKEVRTITALGLREAKALVDEAPKPVKENIPEEEANEIKAKLETAGATVELK